MYFSIIYVPFAMVVMMYLRSSLLCRIPPMCLLIGRSYIQLRIEYLMEEVLSSNRPPHGKARYNYLAHNVQKLYQYSTVDHVKCRDPQKSRGRTHIWPMPSIYAGPLSTKQTIMTVASLMTTKPGEGDKTTTSHKREPGPHSMPTGPAHSS